MLTVFKDDLDKSAPGQFDVEIHLNATLFKQGTEPAAMQRGNLDMAMISAQDIAKQIPAWSVFTAGYLIRSPEHQQKVFRGDIGKEFYQMVEDQMGINILDVGYLGTRELDLRGDKEIKTPADLAGVKLRMPGSDAWQFLGTALGANPVPMAFGEVYTALQTGAIDGQDNPLPTDKAAKFYEVTNQIVLTDHLVDAIFMSMSKTHLGQALGRSAEECDCRRQGGYRLQQREPHQGRSRAGAVLQGSGAEGLHSRTSRHSAITCRNAYLASDFAKDWPAGIVDRVNAVN